MVPRGEIRGAVKHIPDRRAQASQPYMGAEPKYCTIIAEESATIGVVTSLP